MTQRTRLLVVLTAALSLLLAWPHGAARAASAPDGFTIEVLVDGRPVTEYAARGTRYVEALKGREYAIRLRNPLGVRVAVALSVDGLNTIDARRTTARQARKWVLGPYETVTISGWQTGRDEARQFYFTSEAHSYARWLGQANDLGVVSAVFFRERAPEPPPTSTTAPSSESGGRGGGARDERARQSPAPAAAGGASKAGRAENVASENVASENDYAATGIGRAMDHRVEQVWLDLESRPAASLSVRYEYHAQLAKLGVLPPAPERGGLARRERARGFDEFCPVPQQ